MSSGVAGWIPRPLCASLQIFTVNRDKWWIQNFPDGGWGGGANPEDGNTNLFLGQIIPENCMKMKKLDPGAHPWWPPLDPSMITGISLGKMLAD